VSKIVQLSNSDLDQIVRTELSLHPKLELTDIYKLIYQACFGPAHILKDIRFVSHGIFSELSYMSQDYHPLVQDIGNQRGFWRLSLSCLQAFDPVEVKSLCDDLAEVMTLSAEWGADQTQMPRLWQSLTPAIRELFPADKEQWVQVNELACNNHLPSHSALFTCSYRPHYRLIHPQASGKLNDLLHKFGV